MADMLGNMLLYKRKIDSNSKVCCLPPPYLIAAASAAQHASTSEDEASLRQLEEGRQISLQNLAARANSASASKMRAEENVVRANRFYARLLVRPFALLSSS